MAFANLRDIEEALRPGAAISVRDLYTIWNQRLPVQTTAMEKSSAAAGGLPFLEWLQKDLETVTAFTEQALSKQEYLLVCDAYDEAKAYWGRPTPTSPPCRLEDMAKLTSHCAEAKTRLGFTRSARNILEPLANNPNLGRKGRAAILLQVGNIVREEAHHAPDSSSRRVMAANALLLFQRALSLDPELLDALVLIPAMQLLTSGNGTSRLDEARASAGVVLTRIDKIEREQGASFRTIWFQAVAQGILGRIDESFSSYAKLKDRPEASTGSLAEARYNSQFLAEALGHPRRFFYKAFPPLQLLVFSGHLPDVAGKAPRFPMELVPQVRQILRKKLDQFDARVGMVSAAAGADLLFLEALQERPGAQSHVVLPWSKAEFIRTSIAPFEPPGSPPVWEPIFQRSLEQAATVRELGQAYEPSGDVGWEFTQEVMAGLALLTARMSRLDVQPVALWDGKAGRGPGGTESFMELWRQQLQQEPEVIELHAKDFSAASDRRRRSRAERQTMRQEVKSMLFADIVGYSKLTEKVIGDFVDVFLQRLSELLATSPNAPRHVNTWGDAIYAVFDFSRNAGLFALSLTKMIRDGEEEWKKRGLFYLEHDAEKNEIVQRPLNIRIGLHTGPVLAHYNPVQRQIGYTGSHVNRAARIEVITERGEVYASEEFAAMAELDHEIRRRNPGVEKPRVEGFVCEYAGSKALAKSYPGLFRIYRVNPERHFAIEELARTAHALYCDQQEEEGKGPAENPALRPWEELGEDLRDANRSQVADIPDKLYQLGYELAPGNGLNPSEIFITPEQLEILSRREHDRWMEERQRQGWTHGTRRDEARKHHPSLIPWESLSEAEKQKDRDTVRSIPLLISKAGFQLRKIAPQSKK